MLVCHAVTVACFKLREIRSVGIFVLFLCLLSGCRVQSIQFPTLPLEEERHDDPARDAQSRLLTEAHRAFAQSRFATAALFFTRYIERSPDSPRLAEAAWGLGRASEQLGDFGAAMAQYRLLASGQLTEQRDGPLYEDQALRRLDELRQQQADRIGHQRQLALRLAMRQLPPSADRTAWMQGLMIGGVTGLVLEPDRGSLADGRTWTDDVHAVIAEAHRAGLAVWLSVDVHEPRGMALQAEWFADMAIQPGSDQALTNGRPDITHPAYQTALEAWVRNLSKTDCDGLFLPVRAVPGFASEWSVGSFQAFTAAFSLDVSPPAVLRQQAADPLTSERPNYWKWVGWKALSYAKLAARLRTVLRERNPTAIFLVEVHQTTLSAPLHGLEEYGEDVMELAQRTGGSIVVQRDGPGDEALLEQLEPQLAGAERLWIAIPSAGFRAPSMPDLTQRVSDFAGPSRYHTIITAQ